MGREYAKILECRKGSLVEDPLLHWSQSSVFEFSDDIFHQKIFGIVFLSKYQLLPVGMEKSR